VIRYGKDATFWKTWKICGSRSQEMHNEHHRPRNQPRGSSHAHTHRHARIHPDTRHKTQSFVLSCVLCSRQPLWISVCESQKFLADCARPISSQSPAQSQILEDERMLGTGRWWSLTQIAFTTQRQFPCPLRIYALVVGFLALIRLDV
jgi:hypothetical protein